MIKLRILLLTLCLLVPTAAFAETQAATKSWQAFWTQFSSAIEKKSPAALRRLAAPKKNFSLNGGGNQTPAQWIAYIQKDNLWGDYRKAVASGTKPYNCGRGTCRVTNNNELLFQFLGGRWQWIGVMGD